MEASKQHKKHRLQPRGRKAWCWCWCCSRSSRLSISSSDEAESSDSDRFSSVSSLVVHAMVQERLDQMINQRHGRQRREVTKFVVMVAMEKCSDDPREDFRGSMVEMITANRIQEPKDLRNLLNYYVSMNSDEYHGIILEVFHEVCRNLFFIL